LVLRARALLPEPEEIVMASQELKDMRRFIHAVLSDPRLEGGQRDELMRLWREMERLGRSGKVKRRDVVRPISRIAAILHDMLKR
jgi:hypothetical protein